MVIVVVVVGTIFLRWIPHFYWQCGNVVLGRKALTRIVDGNLCLAKGHSVESFEVGRRRCGEEEEEEEEDCPQH